MKNQDDTRKPKIVFKSSLSNDVMQKSAENLIQDKIKTFHDNKIISKKSNLQKKEDEKYKRKVLIRNFENEFDEIKFKNKSSEKVIRKKNCNDFSQKIEKNEKIVSIPVNLYIKKTNKEKQITNSRNKAETIIETTLQNCYNPVKYNSYLILIIVIGIS